MTGRGGQGLLSARELGPWLVMLVILGQGPGDSYAV